MKIPSNVCKVASLAVGQVCADPALTEKIAGMLRDRERTGVNKYGATLDAPRKDYDWRQMASEELLDAVMYQTKEIVESLKKLDKVFRIRKLTIAALVLALAPDQVDLSTEQLVELAPEPAIELPYIEDEEQHEEQVKGQTVAEGQPEQEEGEELGTVPSPAPLM